MGHTHRYKLGFRKKNSGKESQYMVSHPELGSDPPIGSDRELGCDKCNYSEGILCPFKMIYKTRHFFGVRLIVHKIFHVQKGNYMHGGVCTYTPQLAL